MLLNWTKDKAKELIEKLEFHLGQTDYWTMGDTVRRDAREKTDQIELVIAWTNDDGSNTKLSTFYRLWDTTTLNNRFLTVRVHLSRRTTHKDIYTDNNRGDIPTTIDGFVKAMVDIITTFNEGYEKLTAQPPKVVESTVDEPSLVALDELIKNSKFTTATVVGYDYDPGDKRSYGQITVNVNTNLGRLQIVASIGSSSDCEEVNATLDGKRCTLGDLYDFEPCAPHYYAGSRAMTLFESNAISTLQGAVDSWLGISEE